MDNVMGFGLIGAVATMVIAWIWVVVYAFKESVWWGIGSLILNPVALIYAVMRPQRCKYPLTLFVVAVVVWLVAIAYWK